MTDHRAPALRIVHTESSLGWGGQEIRILTEAQGMMARGHQVTLLCPQEARIHAAARERGLPVVALPIARKKPRGMLALRQWLVANPVDVINTHSSTDSWLVALACRLMGHPPPVVRTRHVSAPVPKNSLSRWLYCSAARHIVTTGEALRRQLIEENGFEADRITSVPTGVATDHFVPGNQSAARARVGLPQGVPLIGIVATLRSWKGHRYLIEAFTRLPADAGLVIVGDGPQRQNIEAQVGQLGIGSRATLAGNRADVSTWLQALDVFVLPSYANEGVPQAILQAMCCALPVVSTPVGSIPEVIEHGRTGLMVEPQQVEPLARALATLLADAALRERLGKAARSEAERRFGIAAMLDRMERIFEDATRRG